MEANDFEDKLVDALANAAKLENAELSQAMVTRIVDFQKIAGEMLEQFAKKNTHYGDDFFSTPYSDIERWSSIQRKVARLRARYEKGVSDNMPDETLEDTWKDLAIYSIMELMLQRYKRGGKPNGQEGNSTEAA